MLQCEDRLCRHQRQQRDVRFPEDARRPVALQIEQPDQRAPMSQRQAEHRPCTPAANVRVAGEGLFHAGIHNQQRLAGVRRVVEHARRHHAAKFLSGWGLLVELAARSVSDAFGFEGEVLRGLSSRKHHGAGGLGLFEYRRGQARQQNIRSWLQGKRLTGGLQEACWIGSGRWVCVGNGVSRGGIRIVHGGRGRRIQPARIDARHLRYFGQRADLPIQIARPAEPAPGLIRLAEVHEHTTEGFVGGGLLRHEATSLALLECLLEKAFLPWSVRPVTQARSASTMV